MIHELRLSLQAQAVLAIMLEDVNEEHYGLELAKASRLPTGSIYPILTRLERAGWLTSAWEDIDPKAAGRRQRRYYRLTGKGCIAAQHALEETRRMVFPALSGEPA